MVDVCISLNKLPRSNKHPPPLGHNRPNYEKNGMSLDIGRVANWAPEVAYNPFCMLLPVIN